MVLQDIATVYIQNVFFSLFSVFFFGVYIRCSGLGRAISTQPLLIVCITHKVQCSGVEYLPSTFLPCLGAHIDSGAGMWRKVCLYNPSREGVCSAHPQSNGYCTWSVCVKKLFLVILCVVYGCMYIQYTSNKSISTER